MIFFINIIKSSTSLEVFRTLFRMFGMLWSDNRWFLENTRPETNAMVELTNSNYRTASTPSKPYPPIEPLKSTKPYKSMIKSLNQTPWWRWPRAYESAGWNLSTNNGIPAQLVQQTNSGRITQNLFRILQQACYYCHALVTRYIGRTLDNIQM